MTYINPNTIVYPDPPGYLYDISEDELARAQAKTCPSNICIVSTMVRIVKIVSLATTIQKALTTIPTAAITTIQIIWQPLPSSNKSVTGTLAVGFAYSS